MSRFSGKQFPGALREHRSQKRWEAERRQDTETCPIFPDECDACALCVRLGACECHDCYICGQIECDGHR